MSDNLIESVKGIYPSYNPLDELFPLSICTTCRIKVSSHRPNLPEMMPNFLANAMPKSTRANDLQLCTCTICSTARTTGPLKTKKGRGAKKQLPSDEDETEKPDIENKRSSLTICSKCKQEIGKGISHPKNCTVASSSLNISRACV